MRARIEELKRDRAKLVEDARKVLDKASAENRSPTSEESEKFDRLHAEAKAKGTEATALENQMRRQQEADEELGRSTGRKIKSRRGPGGKDYAGAISLRYGRDARGKAKLVRIKPGMEAHRRCQPEFREAFSDYLVGKAPNAVLQTDIASSGGYLAPEQFNAELIKELDEVLWIRRLARTFMTDAPSMGTPYRSARISSLTRGSELGTPTADTAFKVGRRDITPHYMTGQVNVSRDLMRSAVMNVEQIVRDEINLEVGYFEEQEFMVGTGAGLQALGLFTASSAGIPTTRDVRCQNTDSIDADVMRTAKYTLKQQYRTSPSLRWIFHRDSVSQLAKHKDGNGQYLWQPGVTFAEPDSYHGVPVAESEFAPNTFTASSYVGLLGDLRYFWIVDSLGLEIQRLVETGAGANQDQFIYRRKMDAKPVLAEAFVRIQLHA